MIDWVTHEKAHDMLCVPQDDIDEKPFGGGATVLPTIYRTNFHSPGLPRFASHDESLDIMP